MGNMIDVNNKNLILDFGLLQNVKYKDDINTLDAIIRKLGITGVNGYQDFITFIQGSMVEKGFVCLVNQSSRKVKNNKSEVYDMIVRVVLNTRAQSRLAPGTFLGFYVDIDPYSPTLKVQNIFLTRLMPEAQEFETEFGQCPITILKFLGQMHADQIIREGIFNSNNISEIKTLLSTFEYEKEKWNDYLSFTGYFLKMKGSYSIPYLNANISEVLKVENKVLKGRMQESKITSYKNNLFSYFELREAIKLDGLNVPYDNVFVAKLDCLLEKDNDRLDKLKTLNELSLAPFKSNKNWEEFLANKTAILNYSYDKTCESNLLASINVNIGVSDRVSEFTDYISKVPNTIFGTSSQFEQLQSSVKEVMKNWIVKECYFELDDKPNQNLFGIPGLDNNLQGGYVAYTGIGENVLLDRMRDVLKKISDGQSKNPYLANYLFNTELIQLTQDTNNIMLDERDFVYDLNKEQQEAVVKALNSNDVFILQGPPGTGKTQVICEIVTQLTKMNRRVLVSSQNHEAIRNVLDRLPMSPDLNKVRLTNQLNHRSKAENNFSPDRVVYNYYKSIGKTINDDITFGDNSLNDFMADRTQLEMLILQTQGMHISRNQIRDIDKQLTELKDKISELKQGELSVIKNERNLKNEKFNIELFINAIENNNFNVSISDSELIEKAFMDSIKFDFEVLVKMINNFNDDNSNLMKRINNLFNYLKVSDDKSNQLDILKQQRLKLQREQDIDGMMSIDNQIEKLELESDSNEMTEFKEQMARFKKELLFVLQGLEYEVEKQKTNSSDADINSLEVNINKLQVQKQSLQSKSTDAEKQVRDLVKDISAKFKIDLNIMDVDLEKKAKEKLDQIEEELKNKKNKKEILGELFENIVDYLDENYSINYNTNEDAPTSKFTNQMISDTKRYASTVLDNLINVHAMTLTASDRFKFDRDEVVKRLGIDEMNLKNMDVDTVIIDEASKATLLEILMPLMFGKSLILVGDYRQLPPTLKLQARDVEMVNDMFDKNFEYSNLYEIVNDSAFKNLIAANNKSITTMLRTQYRSHEDIMDVVNKFYDGQLRVEPGVSEQKQHDLIVKDKNGTELINDRSAVYWIDSSKKLDGTLNLEQSEDYSSSLYNELEVEIAIEMLIKLNETVKQKKLNRKPSVAMISFYALHVKRIRQMFMKNKKLFDSIDVVTNTVDDFQGKEADYVLVSLVRNPKNLSSEQGREFLKRFERINVAFSRARELLIIIGAKRAIADLMVEIPSVNDPKITNRRPVYDEIYSSLFMKDAILQPDEVIEI